MVDADAAAPNKHLNFPRGDPATLVVSADDTIPDTLVCWVQPWGSAPSDIDDATIIPTRAVVGDTVTFSFTAEQNAALTRKHRLVLRDTATSATWASCTLTSSIDGDPDTALNLDFVNGTVGVTFNVALFVGADAGGGSGLPDGGATGQILAKASSDDQDYEFISRNAPNGYAGLDGDGTIPDVRIPASIARDSEVGSAVAQKVRWRGDFADAEGGMFQVNDLVEFSGGLYICTVATVENPADEPTEWDAWPSGGGDTVWLIDGTTAIPAESITGVALGDVQLYYRGAGDLNHSMGWAYPRHSKDGPGINGLAGGVLTAGDANAAEEVVVLDWSPGGVTAVNADGELQPVVLDDDPRLAGGGGGGGPFQKIGGAFAFSDYVMSAAESSIVALGAETVTLPDAEEVGVGQEVTITAPVSPLEVLPAAGQTIFGQPSFQMNASGSAVKFSAFDATLVIGGWTWIPSGFAGPEYDLPAWAGRSLADGLLPAIVDGAPAWDGGFGLWINPMSPRFGAVGDGTTDDTAAIEAAMAEAAAGGATVFFPGLRFKVRRRVVVPENVTVRGGPGAVITKDSAVLSLVLSDLTFGDDTVDVAEPELFAVGDEVTVSDDGNWEWNATHAVITNISGSTLSLDRDVVSAYSTGGGAKVYTGFPLITNNAHPTNDPMEPSHTGIQVFDLTLDQNAGPDDPDDEFTNAVIHWENTLHTVVDNVTILRAAGDGYSDQARGNVPAAGVGAPSSNVIRNSTVTAPRRHGLHFGSSLSGARALDNTIEDAGNMGAFFCAHAQQVSIVGNTFRNCWQGVAGADVRLADDSAPAVDTDPSLLRGDIHMIVSANEFIGGAQNEDSDSFFAIELGAFSSCTGNVISGWNGGIRVVPYASDCVINGNTIGLSSTCSRAGIELAGGNHRTRLLANTVVGQGSGSTLSINADVAQHDISISGLSGFNTEGGWALAGMISNLMVRDCQLGEIADPWGLIRIYGTLTDSSIDPTGLDVASSTSSTVISYHDGVGESAQVRLLVNGVGRNGTDDPRTGGQWEMSGTAADQRYDGARVVWDNGGTPQLDTFIFGIGWIALST